MADVPTFPPPTTPPDGYVPQVVPYEYANPCERYKLLSTIYMKRSSGGNTKLVRTKSMDNEREVQFYNMDLSELRAERDKAEDECRALQGLPPLRRRFAIQAGSRRIRVTRP